MQNEFYLFPVFLFHIFKCIIVFLLHAAGKLSVGPRQCELDTRCCDNFTFLCAKLLVNGKEYFNVMKMAKFGCIYENILLK